MTAATFLESRILRSLRRLREHPGSPQLDALYTRVVGELLGDAEAVATTLDPAFELVMHSGDGTFALPGNAIVEGVRATGSAGVLMWIEIDDLVIDGETIAGQGAMLTLQLAQRTLSTAPLGLFLRFSGERMIAEVVFMGAAAEPADVSALHVPTVDGLRSQLTS